MTIHPRRSRKWEEVGGRLENVEVKDDSCIARFSWDSITLPVELQEKLENLIGRREAILRTDESYLVREVTG